MALMDFSLADKVAIVTGGSRGIGRAIALAFATAGAKVVVCGRTLSDLQSVAEEIQGLGRRVLAVSADITIRSDVDNLIKQTLREFGTIDIIVNNAATLFECPFIQLQDEDWDRVITTNLKGYYMCSQAAARVMVERGKGSIINIAARLAFQPLPQRSVYSVSKGGIVTLTRSLAVELGPYNIRVNCIAPGLTRTPMVEPVLESAEFVRKMELETPLRRIGEPEDFGGVAVFLASDAARYVTGQTIFVDGGRHLT